MAQTKTRKLWKKLTLSNLSSGVKIPTGYPQPVNDLICQAQSYLGDTEKIHQIMDAYDLAAWAHRDQRRKSGEPYITHPVQVAVLLADFHLDHATLIAAILHDTVEDTEVTHEQLVTRFGKEVAELVEGVTKIGQIQFETKEHAEAENIRKMLLAMSRDIRHK